ncbi:MAG: hypothetical protein K8R53_08720, partial [Bacteroidales bacterium]|nr:hypothetical protein [Bacteroidales bacterium]
MKNINSRVKIYCIFLIALIFTLGFGSLTYAGTYQFTLEAGSYEIVDAGDGYQEIRMKDFGQLLDSGKPKLPSKIFAIAIPQGVTADSIEIVGNGMTELPGTYDITPTLMESPLNATEEDIRENKVIYDEIIAKAYSSDAVYPETEGKFITQGAYRKYNLVQVRFSPFQYKAKSKKLIYYSSATISVNYSIGYEEISEEGTDSRAPGFIEDWLPEVEESASKILENYDDAKDWYPAPVDGESDPETGLYEFVIVTTAALVDAVQPLVDWEKSKGRTVYVATTAWIDANYSGADLQRRIRYFLRDKYPSAQWGITNVCIVGDLTDIPMRSTHPYGGTSTTVIPTDLYYAELSEMDSLSWDDDWDGRFGEYGEDTIDFIQEVCIGRIPWSDPATVEAICLKIANFDYSNYMAGYKDNVLFNMSYFWWDTDGAVLSEYLLAEYQFDDLTPYRIYERTVYHPGYTDHRWSIYSANEYMSSVANPFVDEWSSSRYGFVNWLGHGSWLSAAYHCGDGLTCRDFIHRDDCTSLSDDYPAIVFSDSCSTAYPDADSLGRNVMKHGGVSFVGASRVAYGFHGWDHPSDGNAMSFHYEYARRIAWNSYTVGTAFKYALWTMYNTHNWGTSWLQMFEWTLFGNPDMRALLSTPPLPNLDYFFRTGWDSPVVPRSTSGATSTSCSVTATLPGNTSNTYINWTWENTGTINSPAAQTRVFIDENYKLHSTWSLAAGASGMHTNYLLSSTITGGRHSLYYRLDYLEDVWETSETDNFYGRQFVWSPLGLSDDTPIYRSAPPHHDAWASPYWFNNDGFSFSVGQVHPNKWWSAVGILPYNAAADYDLRLWDIGDYTGSEGGFGPNYIEYSNNGTNVVEFVIVNDNMAPAGTYYAGVINANNQTGNFHIEEASSTKVFDGKNGPYFMPASGVLDIYEYYMYAGEYGFKLEQTAGTCDLGISLYDDGTVHCSKLEHMTDGYANSGRDGQNEYMRVTIPDSGYHGLVVWKSDYTDYSKTSTYNIKVGKCATPSALSNPSPADGATDVSVNTDLNWADSTDTEYYEVWLKEGTGTWIKMGETETSNWPLGTLNEATQYEWFIKAWNICGDSVLIYWDFTTEDNTAPTPNPMTWAAIPYELNTSQIRMTSTTASDPTAPITYYHDFVSSPTGGLGGSDSGWISSTQHTDYGLGTNHQYGYRVMARDGSFNQTGYSGISYDYTDIETPTGITF